jgi:hypothetical protein
MYEYFLDSVARRNEQLVPLDSIDITCSVKLQTHPEDVKHYTILNHIESHPISNVKYDMIEALKSVKHFDQLVLPLLMNGKAVVAGGSLVSLFCGLHQVFERGDIDVFFLNMSHQEMMARVKAIIKEVLSIEEEFPVRDRLIGSKIQFCENFIQIGRIQFILCVINSKSVLDVLTHFDLDCCKIAFDGNQFYTTTLGALALTTGYCMINRRYMNKYFGKFSRVVKYTLRGFKFIFPQANLDTLNKMGFSSYTDTQNFIEEITNKVTSINCMGKIGFSTSLMVDYMAHNGPLTRVLHETCRWGNARQHTCVARVDMDDNARLYYDLNAKISVELLEDGMFEMFVEKPETITRDFAGILEAARNKVVIRGRHIIQLSKAVTYRDKIIMRKTLLSTQHLPLMEDEFLLGINQIHSATINVKSATAIQRCWKEYLYQPNNFLFTTYGSGCFKRLGGVDSLIGPMSAF